ncbi:MAG: hypothetical protein ACNA8L_01670 [Luteolibacter sp.]
MKTIPALTSCAILAMASCDNMNGVGQNGGFDPLGVPGAHGNAEAFGGTQRIRPGQFVTAAIDNTAFYNQRPGPEAEADKLLKRGTSMKVISTSGSLFRVELDSGELGFVPSVMVEDASAASSMQPGSQPSQPSQPAFNPAGMQAPLEPLPEYFPSDVLPDVIEPELPTPDI